MTIPTWTPENVVTTMTVYVLMGGVAEPISVTAVPFTNLDVPATTFTSCNAPQPVYTGCNVPPVTWTEKNFT